jgi:hypothetical protein
MAPPQARDVVVHAASATQIAGAWRLTPDASAASGVRLWHPNAGVKGTSARVAPTHYFEVRAELRAGVPYRLWLRGRAEGNAAANDSVAVQFATAVNNTGAPVYRIGTTGAAVVAIRNCSTCALNGWGWQDNGAFTTLGPLITFAESGAQTIRIQTLEDGVSVDQIVLSPATYLAAPPGLQRQDMTILPEGE